MALLSQRVTKGRGASVLPHDGIRDGTASGALPEERGLALVGDADRDDLARAEAGERQRLGRHVALRAPDLGRIVLDPAGTGEDLAEFLLGLPEDPAVLAEGDRAGARGALVEGEHGLHL